MSICWKLFRSHVPYISLHVNRPLLIINVPAASIEATEFHDHSEVDPMSPTEAAIDNVSPGELGMLTYKQR